MAKKVAKDEPEVVASTAVIVPEAQSTELAVYDYGEQNGAGFENQTREDMGIPFLSVLQALSPQVCKEPGEGGIEGARPGMLYNSVTNEIHPGKDGVYFVPATTQHVFAEYVPREKGGGFKGVHQIESQLVAACKAKAGGFGKLPTDEGMELIETFYIYGVLTDKTGEPIAACVLSFSSTKIKAYKAIMGKIRTFQLAVGDRKITPPLFAHWLKIVTFADKSPKGDFYNVQLVPAKGTTAESLLPVKHPALLAAMELRDSVNSGAAKAAFNSQTNEGGEGGGPKGDVPF